MHINVPFGRCLIVLGALLGCGRDDPASSSTPAMQHDLISLENRAVGLMGQFKYDEAAAEYEQLAKRGDLSDAKRQQFAVDLAIALLNRRQDGDLERAATLLETIIARDEKNLRAAYCRAVLYFNDGETVRASTLFQRVSAADPTDSYAVYYVGQCRFLQQEFRKALEQFLHAQQLDPYLRSAYYGAFQAAQRLKKRELAHEQMEKFQRLEQNPRARLAELKYTRMGPKAEVFASSKSNEAPSLPKGPLFSELEPLAMQTSIAPQWNAGEDKTSRPALSVADIDGDGRSDIFIAQAFSANDSAVHNAVLIQQQNGFRLDLTHPLSQVQFVTAALWGDYDNNGRTDVFLCRGGPNQLWQNQEDGKWREISLDAQLPSNDFDTVDGACFDADHDGDLDYLLCNSDGPRQLLNNNRDGTFRTIAEELKIQGSAGNRQVLLADLDADDDIDFAFLNSELPHEVFINDRFWDYHAATGFEDFIHSSCIAAVAVDSDVDGQVELFTLLSSAVYRWAPDDAGNWSSQLIADSTELGEIDPSRLTVVDVKGDGQPEIVVSGSGGWNVFDLSGKQTQSYRADDSENSLLATGLLQQPSGPAIVGLFEGKGPMIWKPGSGRFPFVLASFTGKTDKSLEMRSNASGIGVQGVARVGGHWSAIAPIRRDSGPGQSLQPIAVGLGDNQQIDFLRLLWPDGVSQTELNLRPGELREISETQRQAGSCPLVFVWDGERYMFVADILGAGGIGFNLGRAEYYPPRPTESLLLPSRSMKPLHGKYVVKLGEPMEEICYFDAVRLVAYDLPPGWKLTLDERFGAADPLPTGKPVYYREHILPVFAKNDRDEDVTQRIASVDRIAAPLAKEDCRFIGLTNEHSVTLTFDQSLDTLNSPTLLFDGWVEYAYSQTAFAAWQAREQYTEPTIEAQGADGQWRVVCERFGYMAGTPRQATMPLDQTRLPTGTEKLRITTNMEVYWDRLAVIDAEHNHHVRRHELKLSAALIDDVGFSTRTLLDQRFPVYDYDNRPPFGDARHPAGFYTSFGDACELVEATDDAIAIIGPGEELHLEFERLGTPLPDGWTREFVLEADGWCKDADLFTRDAGAVEPLPTRGPLNDTQAEIRNRLHQKYNTRYRSGY